MNNRLTVLGVTHNLIPLPGANIQHVGTTAPATQTGNFSLRFLQGQIVTYLTSFVVSHSAWDARLENAVYDGAASIPMWTTTTFFLALTNDTHFRRKANWGDNFSFGYAQAGDIIGPWIMEDLQRALNMMIWTRYTYILDRKEENNRKLGTGQSEASWAAAKSATETSYTGSSTSTATICEAFSYGNYYIGIVGWQAILSRTYQYGHVTIDSTLAKEVDWYCWAQIDALYTQFMEVVEFGAHGDEVIQNAFSLWLTETKAAGSAEEWATTTKIASGSLTQPVWTSEPAQRQENYLGYQIDTAKLYAVARWDVDGGFTYY
jgi:hypothetical protein